MQQALGIPGFHGPCKWSIFAITASRPMRDPSIMQCSMQTCGCILQVMAPRSRGEGSCFQMGVASMSETGELIKWQKIGGWEVMSMGCTVQTSCSEKLGPGPGAVLRGRTPSALIKNLMVRRKECMKRQKAIIGCNHT